MIDFDPICASEPAPSDLMERYQRGDARSFRELYAFVAPRLRGYLVKLTRNPALADDLLQMTFLKLHRSRAAYIRGADPVPWIYAIARHTFIDEVRRRNRTIVDIEADRLPELAVGVTVDRGDEPGADLDLAREAINALAALSSKQRDAVVLTKLQGKSVREAAEIAGTSVNTLKVRAHRGYATLRRLLAPYRAARAAA